MLNQKYWNRKDVATILECSVRTVKRNERVLGLDKARRDINPRLVRYLVAVALPELVRRGLLEAVK